MLFEELVLLRDFEKTENSLYEKLQEKTTEKRSVDKQVTDARHARIMQCNVK